MAMVLIVAVVIAKHPAIVDWANPRINVGQAVLHYFLAGKPNFFFQNRATSLAGEIEGLIDPLLQLGWLLSSPRVHHCSLTQVGYR
jgi:hypothetical protein